MTPEPRFDGTQLIVGVDDSPEIYDARLLISALLVYAAKSDGSISDVETNRMIALLSTQLHLPSPQALDRLSSAIMALANDPALVTKMQAISRGLSADEKQQVFGMILDIIAVDAHLHPGEIEAISVAGQILGLSLDTIHSALRSISLDR